MDLFDDPNFLNDTLLDIDYLTGPAMDIPDNPIMTPDTGNDLLATTTDLFADLATKNVKKSKLSRRNKLKRTLDQRTMVLPSERLYLTTQAPTDPGVHASPSHDGSNLYPYSNPGDRSRFAIPKHLSLIPRSQQTLKYTDRPPLPSSEIRAQTMSRQARSLGRDLAQQARKLDTLNVTPSAKVAQETRELQELQTQLFAEAALLRSGGEQLTATPVEPKPAFALDEQPIPDSVRGYGNLTHRQKHMLQIERDLLTTEKAAAAITGRKPQPLSRRKLREAHLAAGIKLGPHKRERDHARKLELAMAAAAGMAPVERRDGSMGKVKKAGSIGVKYLVNNIGRSMRMREEGVGKGKTAQLMLRTKINRAKMPGETFDFNSLDPLPVTRKGEGAGVKTEGSGMRFGPAGVTDPPRGEMERQSKEDMWVPHARTLGLRSNELETKVEEDDEMDEDDEA